MKGYGKQVFLIFLLMMCLLTSCRSQARPPKEDPNAIQLYFLNSQSDTGSAIASEPYVGERTATVRLLVNALLSGPTHEGLKSPLPSQTVLRGWSVEDGLLTVDLSEHYGDLSGIDLTLADYCITLTLCQLEGVDRVRITVAGSALAYRGHDILSPEEAVLSGLVPRQEDPPEQELSSGGSEDAPSGETVSGAVESGSLPDRSGPEEEIPPEKSPAAS